MTIPILVIGKSGSGKSFSMANIDPYRVALISVLGKPLPFRGKFDQLITDDYDKVIRAIKATKREIVVIDDAGYLMTNMFMKDHSNVGQGNAVFGLYNTIGDKFWNLIEEIRKTPGNKRVYIIMHEEQNELGAVKPKSIGRMVDEKVCLEGMFTIVLRCMVQHGKHIFRTQSDGMDVAKTPAGMFDSEEIPNDLQAVDDAVCAYYEIENIKEDKNNETA